jgi:hypothetical protein
MKEEKEAAEAKYKKALVDGKPEDVSGVYRSDKVRRLSDARKSGQCQTMHFPPALSTSMHLWKRKMSAV